MVRQQNWYDPSVLRKVRIRIIIILWVVVLCMLYLNHGWMLSLFKKIIN